MEKMLPLWGWFFYSSFSIIMATEVAGTVDSPLLEFPPRTPENKFITSRSIQEMIS